MDNYKNYPALRKAVLYCRTALQLPLLGVYLFANQKSEIEADMERWSSVKKLSGPFLFRLASLLSDKPFRTLVYHRVKYGSLAGEILVRTASIFFRPVSTLVIYTREIGPGLIIQHGVCTIIAARRIGRNCWINQQVTIGYTNDSDCPTLGDNVSVGCGAKILGNVTVGNNVKVGANAVVVKDVPENCTVVGVPARIVRKSGLRTHIESHAEEEPTGELIHHF